MANRSIGMGTSSSGGGFIALIVLVGIIYLASRFVSFVGGLFHHGGASQSATSTTASGSVPGCDLQPCPAGGPPAPPIRQTVPSPQCVVTTVDQKMPGNCESRYINFDDLYGDLNQCLTSECYARKILAIQQQPVIIVYQPGQVAAESNSLHAQISQAVQTMGDSLRDVKNNSAGLISGSGSDDFPDLATLNSDIDQAVQEEQNIDQPINESADQRMRRLGIGPYMIQIAQLASH